ncbi:MAG TPA: protocatechuate 3,4-dioxygenase subunit alpha [Candidatus Dormibacteraeota bacterium]
MRAPTPSQTVGPFFGFALPFDGDANGASGESHDAIRVEGHVLDGIGEPVGDALIEASEGDQFARCRTDSEGAFHFNLRRPVAGEGTPFFYITVFARGLLRHLHTRMYLPDEDGATRVDRVLQQVDDSRRPTLFARQEGEILRFDIRLQGDGETVFFAL